MTELPKEINVVFDDPEHRDGPLDVEEFHPYEPSAYVHDPGYTAFEFYPTAQVEYFISLSGDVYVQPENRKVGVAPEIQSDAARAESHAEGLAELDRDDYEEYGDKEPWV